MRQTRQGGFTIVEVMVTLAIVALLSGVAMMSFSSLVKTLRDRQVLAVLVGDFREAQIRAVENSKPYGVQFDASARVALLRWSSGGKDCGASGGTWETVRTEKNLPSGVEIDLPAGARTCVSFDSNGQPVFPAAKITHTGATLTTAESSILRLSDGVVMRQKPEDGVAVKDDPAVASFRTNKDQTAFYLSVDLGAVEYVDTLVLGLVSCTADGGECLTPVAYPSGIVVEGIKAVGETYRNAAVDPILLPLAASENWERSTTSISIRDAWRTLRITLTPTTLEGTSLCPDPGTEDPTGCVAYTLFDEVDTGELRMKVIGLSGTFEVTVGKATGRVSVQKLE